MGGGRSILRIIGILLVMVLSCFWGMGKSNPVYAQGDNPNPPERLVKLIFIHHSTGENWLTDGYGNLGRVLAENNYFVSDTNYGWGPNSIGDRTDIPNWQEWFRSPDTPRYMAALFAESGQNASYTRLHGDPGGENEIVMFKSCFPNSNLDGNPDDPPAPGNELTVSNAKFIYNDLLQYFITRPDKLFIVITAPPVQDPTFAENARAFNTWLVNNWLRENNYPYNNVAVFDFYNVLTHPENHHRFANGQVEWVVSVRRNTLFYPTEDDHPSPAGSRKATEEFVPLLNVFYHRWRAGAPPAPPPAEVPATQAAIVAPPPVSSDIIDNFESGPPPGTPGWEPFWQDNTETRIICAPQNEVVYAGNAALHIQFDVKPNTWGTCALLYDEIHNWQSAKGISFYMRASQPALVFNIDVYGGTPEARTTHIYTIETTPEMVGNWVYMEVPWEMILGAEWESNTGMPFNPVQSMGMAFGFNTFPDTPNVGELWVDEIHLFGEAGASPEAPTPVQVMPTSTAQPPTAIPPTAPPAPTEEGKKGIGVTCPGSLAFIALMFVGVLWLKRSR